MTRGHAFVDESKAKDYLLVSAVLGLEELDGARGVIRDLLLPGQPRLHMKHEHRATTAKDLSGDSRALT